MPKRTSALVYFFCGVGCGFVLAICQIGTLGYAKYPEPVFGFWMLIGGLSGLLVAGYRRIFSNGKPMAELASSGEMTTTAPPPE